MTPNDFDFLGETKLMGYGESDSSGAWIKLQVLPEDLETFRGLKGEVFETALRNVDRNTHREPPKPEKGPYGTFARDLVLSGFFNMATVREHFGGDKAFLGWLKTQKCAITREMDVDTNTGEMTCDPAHVRRAGDAGTSYKPKYSAIPLRHHIHQLQHNDGEEAVVKHCKVDTKELTPREWFEMKAADYVRNWQLAALKHELSLDSLTLLSPREFWAWCQHNHLDREVPPNFKKKYEIEMMQEEMKY